MKWRERGSFEIRDRWAQNHGGHTHTNTVSEQLVRWVSFMVGGYTEILSKWKPWKVKKEWLEGRWTDGSERKAGEEVGGGAWWNQSLIKALSSLRLEQNGEFISARLLDLLSTLLSQMCYARGGTWLKSLLDSPEPPQRRLWVKWPESYFERRPPGSRLQHPPQRRDNNGVWSWWTEWEEKHASCDFHHGEVTVTAQLDSLGLYLCRILPEYNTNELFQVADVHVAVFSKRFKSSSEKTSTQQTSYQTVTVQEQAANFTNHILSRNDRTTKRTATGEKSNANGGQSARWPPRRSQLCCWLSLKSAKLLLHQTLVHPPLLPPSVTECSADRAVSSPLRGALQFYNWSVTTARTLTCVEVCCW